MRLITFIFLSIYFKVAILAQHPTEPQSGEVTFVTAENIYVRFQNTDQIQLGDTLALSKNGINTPCLIAKQKSSSSIICILINGCDISIKDKILHTHTPDADKSTHKIKKGINAEPETQDSNPDKSLEKVNENSEKVVELKNKEKIKGRISLASYSNINMENSERNRHRAMGRLSVDADHIAGSKLSANTYLNYRENFISGEGPVGRKTKFFRIYNLSATYDANSSTAITFGRNINRKMSSVGAIDGLQIDKQFGSVSIGAIAGFRPDILNYGFNSSLFQYGGYIGIRADKADLNSETTIGAIEQHNGGAVDRRYAYFQHRSAIRNNLNLFGSAELDLFSSVNDVSETKLRLTNLFVSAQYRINRRISFSLSFDARKRIIYYETLRSDIDRLLADDESRKGIRTRLNIRLKHGISTGLSYGKRFQNNSQNKSNNINGFITKSNFPSIGGSLSLRFNWNKSNYLESKIAQLNYSKSLFQRKLYVNLYMKNAIFSYFSNETSANRQYYGASLTWSLMKKLSLGFSGELSVGDKRKTYRVNTRLIKRF